MVDENRRFLKSVAFKSTVDWNIKHIFSGNSISSKYDFEPIGKYICRKKDAIKVINNVYYKRITIKTNHGGVIVRDTVPGNVIKTKDQYCIRAGQLAVSKIDARNGAFGIVPTEADRAIITGNFWVYDVDNTKANIKFLILIFSSSKFVQVWQDCSNGSGNRLYLQEKKFLNYKIPFPAIEEQNRIVEKYDSMIAEAAAYEKEIEKLESHINTYLCDRLGIQVIPEKSMNESHLYLRFVRFKEGNRWDPSYFSSGVKILSKYPMIPLSKVISKFMVNSKGKSLRMDPQKYPDQYFDYISMDHIEKNTGKRTVGENKTQGKQIKSQTIFVPHNYFMYGKLRPYLNKYWFNDTTKDNIICSSEFYVFKIKSVNTDYFKYVLASSIVQMQIRNWFSGSRMPRMNEYDFMNIKIPLPKNMKDQQIIAEKITEVKEKIATFRRKAESLRELAKNEFERSVFSK